jgi:hypothetical protein
MLGALVSLRLRPGEPVRTDAMRIVIRRTADPVPDRLFV